jgi:hypothetical protein
VGPPNAGCDPQFGILTRLNSQLIDLARRYGADYLVVERAHVEARLAFGYPVSFAQVYPVPGGQTTAYVIFRVEGETMDWPEHDSPGNTK